MLNRFIILILILLFMGCAYDFQKEAVYTWEIMQERIPKCRDKEMPMIMIDNNLELPLMGKYIQSCNLIILKYAYFDILEHEFHHACGDMFGEHYLPIEVGGDWRR